jgi:RNA polymerase sigma-70 factor (ECF subfamily)
MIYCVVPRDIAPKLYALLGRHFRDDPAVEVVVEGRASERRSGAERRDRARATMPSPGGEERRRIHSDTGRRIADRRAATVVVEGPPLPRKARPHKDRLAFIERLELGDQELEDADTARLVTRIQAGEESFSVLYMRYFDRVYGYLRLALDDAHEAEDAAQLVFIKVLSALPRYERRRGTPFRAWLFVVARNYARTELTRRSRLRPLDLAGIASDRPQSISETLPALDWLSDAELRMFIERLPAAQRQVVFLRYAIGLSMREIAEVLHLSPEAVRKQHTRALKFLRDRLTALGREPRRGGDRIGAEVILRTLPVIRARRYSIIA